MLQTAFTSVADILHGPIPEISDSVNGYKTKDLKKVGTEINWNLVGLTYTHNDYSG